MCLLMVSFNLLFLSMLHYDLPSSRVWPLRVVRSCSDQQCRKPIVVPHYTLCHMFG